MNKLKLSLITIAMTMSANVKAQTFYSCIPQGCPSGQYFDGVKCLALPSSGNSCSAGYVWSNKQSKCIKDTCEVEIHTNKIISVDSGVTYSQTKKISAYGGCPNFYYYKVTMKSGTSITYDRVVSSQSCSGCPPTCSIDKNTYTCPD